MATYNRLTLLLVDDDESLRESLSRLAERANYHVLTARDGDEALYLCAQGVPIDIVLSDVEMPGSSGHAVEAAFAPRCPVVLMSGSFSASGHNRLAKPFTGTELTRTLQTALLLHPAA